MHSGRNDEGFKLPAMSTIDVDKQRGEEATREVVEEARVEEEEMASIPFCLSSSTCISTTGDGEHTAACEAELGCLQDASTNTEPDSGRGEDTGLDRGGEEGEVMDGERRGKGEVTGTQLLFPSLAACDWGCDGGRQRGR